MKNVKSVSVAVAACHLFLIGQVLDSFIHRSAGSFILSVDAATLLDLSEDFPLAELYNANTGSDEMKDVLDDSWKVLGFMVIDDGKAVAEHYADGERNQKAFGAIWSCTKSITSLQIGMMEKEGLLSVSDTLLDIQPRDNYWKGIDKKKKRQELTIEQILTMTAGLELGFEYFIDLISFRPWGGNGEIEALEYHDIANRKIGKVFDYVLVGNILSYVIQGLTGQAPQSYFPFEELGISSSDYDWEKTDDGVGLAWHGLSMNVPSMAKFGQLYSQNGFINDSTQIINDDWVARSTATDGINPEYGYSFWTFGTYSCAIGLNEQLICFDHTGLNRVIAVRSNANIFDTDDPMKLVDMAFSLDFSEPSGGKSGSLRAKSRENGRSFVTAKDMEMFHRVMEMEQAAFNMTSN